MPGLVRKLIIFATVDGFTLQPYGGWEDDKSLQLKFKDGSITPHAKVAPEGYKERPYLESHGIIGLFTVASHSFLLCITRREQVAQVFSKPIYVIQDVAILPLSSQPEATRAIVQAQADVQKAKVAKESETASSTSEDSDDDILDNFSVGDPSGSPSTPSPRMEKAARSEGQAGVVREVLERRSQYGRFASQWFSRRGWLLDSRRSEGLSMEKTPMVDREDGEPRLTTAGSESCNDASISDPQTASEHRAIVGFVPEQDVAHRAAIEMLPKILRTTKILLNSRSFYFSYDFNITKSFASSPMASLKQVSARNLEPEFFWNRQLAAPFLDAGLSSVILPIMQGFIGQQPFLVKETSKDMRTTDVSKPSEVVAELDTTAALPDHSLQSPDDARSFLLTLISRKSVNRSGLRYLRRGIDDEGNCANSVETEQILSSPTWDEPEKIRSFVQLRASIPLYFSQSPYTFKPIPTLHQAPEINRRAFKRHFQELQRRYGDVQIVLLVDQQGGEKQIGEQYQKFTKSFNRKLGIPELGFEWFDFHSECRGMKFENVQKLVSSMGQPLSSFGETEIDGQITSNRQSGILRTNCMDCLDRTNVVQSAFAQQVLQKDLEEDGFAIDFVHDTSTQWFNSLWADNGDAISRQYASTAALKGDYTRTRKRNYRGALNDFGLTLTRYYNNIVNDYFSQAVIDVLLGNVTAMVFEDFEATMMSADPGISVDKIRQNAINSCAKIVIEDSEEELTCGWAMLAPAQTNTLRTLPFEEAILLLTDRAVYGCKFDWNSEKVASFERIDHRSITKIHYGIYVTSTLTDRQMDEEYNAGLVITYKPGMESIKRVNTRSLRVSEDPDCGRTDVEVKDSGILSWLRTRNAETTYSMAMKVIPQRSLPDQNGRSRPRSHDVAEQISQEIQQAVGESFGDGRGHDLDLLEQSDIITSEDARRRTGYLEQIGHSIKKLVWT